jgi:hypothetical protein
MPGPMQIVDTTKQPWELIVPNTRGGDVYRKVIVAAQGGDQVSYDVRLELFGEGDRAYTSIRHRHDFEQRTTGIWPDPGESIKLHATAGCQLLKVRFPAPASHIALTPTSSSRIDISNYVDAVIQLRCPFARRASRSRRAHSVSHQVSAPMVSTVKPASARSRACAAPAHGMPTGTPWASATRRT